MCFSFEAQRASWQATLPTWAEQRGGDAHPWSSGIEAVKGACVCGEGGRGGGEGEGCSRPGKPGAVCAAGKGYASYDFVFSL